MSLSYRMFYLFLNIRRFCPVMFNVFLKTSLQHAAQRVLVGYAFMPAVQAFMQAACRLSTCSCRLSTPSCSMSMHSCRLPVLSDLLLWSGTFSTHCTDANRRETMPKQHYITCLAQCVPTLHPPSGFVSTPPSFYCHTLLGSLPLANNGQHSASIYFLLHYWSSLLVLIPPLFFFSFCSTRGSNSDRTVTTLRY